MLTVLPDCCSVDPITDGEPLSAFVDGGSVRLPGQRIWCAPRLTGHWIDD